MVGNARIKLNIFIQIIVVSTFHFQVFVDTAFNGKKCPSLTCGFLFLLFKHWTSWLTEIYYNQLKTLEYVNVKI